MQARQVSVRDISTRHSWMDGAWCMLQISLSLFPIIFWEFCNFHWTWILLCFCSSTASHATSYLWYRISWSRSVVQNDSEKSVLSCGGCNQSIVSHSRATIKVQNSQNLYFAPCWQVCMYLLKSVPYMKTDIISEKVTVCCGFTTSHSCHANPSIGYGMIKTSFLLRRQIIHALCNFSKGNKSDRELFTLVWT